MPSPQGLCMCCILPGVLFILLLVSAIFLLTWPLLTHPQLYEGGCSVPSTSFATLTSHLVRLSSCLSPWLASEPSNNTHTHRSTTFVLRFCFLEGRC